MLKLYCQLLVCIFKARATKGIQYSNDDKSDVELISEIILCSSEEINKFMISLIEKAKQLILESSEPLNEIYLKTGFTNRNTFIRNFKAGVGFTPSEYKKQKKN